MKRLSPQYLQVIETHLRQCGVSGPLFDELLDHMASEVEHLMWDGISFSQAVEQLQGTVNKPVVQELVEGHSEEVGRYQALTDIVFEHRNKAFGAYALRMGYADTMLRATLIGLAIFSLLFVLPQL